MVILVHGTFACDVAWCKPGGDFYEALKISAQQRGHSIIPFTWSGKLHDMARLQAAQSLVDIIASYPATEKKILVGHSHGGNVINLATQIINTPDYPLLHDVFLPKTAPAVTPPEDLETMLEDVGLVASRDWFVPPTLFSLRFPARSYIIDTVYLLATPVDEQVYAPCPDIVGHVFNLYSTGDYIQTVFGTYERQYTAQERVTNIQVTIKGSGILGGDQPTHAAMHHEWLAEILFDIASTSTIIQIPDAPLPMHQDQEDSVKKIQAG